MSALLYKVLLNIKHHLNFQGAAWASGMTTSKPLWKWRGYGKRGKPKAGFPRFPQPLGNLAQTARFPHSHSGGGPRWKSGKPKAGFPLFHARSAMTTPVCFSSNLFGTYHNPTERRTPADRARHWLDNRDFRLTPHWNQISVSGSSRTGIKLRFQAHFWIGKCSFRMLAVF
jgi:hypothetical protein